MRDWRGDIKSLKKRKTRTHIEDELPLPDRKKIDFLAQTLVKHIEEENFRRKSAPIKEILKLVGAGLFLASSFAIPTLPQALYPFLKDKDAKESWKRFNIPYLKRVLTRLESQKLVEIEEIENVQVVKITDRGRKRILRYSFDELEVKKPKVWDGTWWLVSYDLPEKSGHIRNILREYLKAWGFYPFQESVFLHAYPCGREVDFLREYLGVGKYVRILLVKKIENDEIYREFFGV